MLLPYHIKNLLMRLCPHAHDHDTHERGRTA